MYTILKKYDTSVYRYGFSGDYKCKMAKGFDTETNNLKFSRTTKLSRTPIINKKKKKNPNQFQAAE